MHSPYVPVGMVFASDIRSQDDSANLLLSSPKQIRGSIVSAYFFFISVGSLLAAIGQFSYSHPM